VGLPHDPAGDGDHTGRRSRSADHVRWAAAISLLTGAFILVGFFASGDIAHLAGTANAVVTVGKWLQFVTIVVGTVAALASLVRPPVRRSAVLGS
jgi:hypothetical protein